MLLAERAGRKLEPWSNSRPRGMAVIAYGFILRAVTESGLSAYFISSFELQRTDKSAAIFSASFFFPSFSFTAFRAGRSRIQKFFESDHEMRPYIFLQVTKTGFHTNP